MIGICKDGHVTGQRHCGLCGADRIPGTMGTVAAGVVQVQRHERPRDENGRNELDAIRRATRHNTRAQGPNKFNNGTR